MTLVILPMLFFLGYKFDHSYANSYSPYDIWYEVELKMDILDFSNHHFAWYFLGGQMRTGCMRMMNTNDTFLRHLLINNTR